MSFAAKPIEEFETSIGVPRSLKTSTVLGYAPGAGLPAPQEIKPELTPSLISASATRAGGAERRRLRGRRGRASTVLTPSFLAPAQIGQAGLKTKFG